ARQRRRPRRPRRGAAAGTGPRPDPGRAPPRPGRRQRPAADADPGRARRAVGGRRRRPRGDRARRPPPAGPRPGRGPGRRPRPGPARDRTLAVLHPVQDVGNALQLTRIRDALDALSGDGGDGPAATGRDGARRQDGDRAAPRGDGGDEPAGDGEGEEGTERDDGPRAPTPDDPLRAWVGGDFMAQAIGRSLAAAGDATGVVEPGVRCEAASGLTRRDYFDWPAAVEEALDEHDPEVVVLVLGVNDAQGIVRPDGTPAQVDEPGWADEYGRRV